MENEELKPCPFCGGKAYIQKHSYRYAYWIKCYDCRVETEAYEFEDEALKVWNRRVGKDE